MRTNAKIKLVLAGLCAGSVTGLFGAGGGMLLVPLLTTVPTLKESDLFPTSVAITLPIAIVSLLFGAEDLPIREALPYLIGSVIGGIASGLWGKKIPTLWLHRILGITILWGGVKYIC
jgi:uncharacterized membrane protein YfcA